MKYGLFLPSIGKTVDPSFILETAIKAEKVGWDGIFLPDHLFYENNIHCLDPIIMLSAIAARTKTIKLGTWVVPIPRRSPWQVARDLATLDQLSKGRVMLGAGLGSPPSDFSKIGLDPTPRILAERMDESLDIITGLWQGEAFNFNGKHYNIEDAKLGPTPYQKSRIPILIAGRWPSKKSITRGSKWDGIMPISSRWPGQFKEDELRDLVSYYDKQCQLQGKSLGDILVSWNNPGGIGTGKMRDVANEIGITWLLHSIIPPFASPHVASVEVQVEQALKGPNYLSN